MCIRDRIAREHSEDRFAIYGGNHGNHSPQDLPPRIMDKALQLEEGEMVGPFETMDDQMRHGVLILRRQKLQPTVSARHILISYEGADRADKASRTKEEAATLANECVQKLKGGEDFKSLAKEISDDSSSSKGGDLGEFSTARMTLPFEEAAFALEVGGISDVVETEFGFHIIQRYK